MRLNLIGSNQKGLSAAINNQENENCYIVQSPRSRGEVALVGSPGTATFCSGTSGEPRGGVKFDGVAYFVMGTTLYSVSSAGVQTSIGTIPGTERVSMAADRTTLIVVNGTTTGYFYASSTLSTVTLPYAAYSVDLLDGYALFVGTGQTWFISEVNDVDSFDALDFATANKSPDDLVGLIEDHSEIFLFGEKTTEPWFNSADIDFPFSQNTSGIIERGLYSRHTLVKDDNTVMFLGNDLIVYRLEGYTPVRISDDSSETLLSNLLKDGYQTDLQNSFAFIYTDHGHKFYQLTVPGRLTVVFDIATGGWHKKKHWNYQTHIAGAYVNCYGKHLVAGLDGKIYEMSRSYYSDAGTTLKRLRRSHCFSVEDKLLKWKMIKLMFDFGTTPVLSGQGSDPKVIVRFSPDYGRTYGNEKFLSLGEAGDYLTKAVKRNCGASRSRVIEFYVTDPVPFYIVDAYASLQ